MPSFLPKREPTKRNFPNFLIFRPSTSESWEMNVCLVPHNTYCFLVSFSPNLGGCNPSQGCKTLLTAGKQGSFPFRQPPASNESRLASLGQSFTSGLFDNLCTTGFARLLYFLSNHIPGTLITSQWKIPPSISQANEPIPPTQVRNNFWSIWRAHLWRVGSW